MVVFQWIGIIVVFIITIAIVVIIIEKVRGRRRNEAILKKINDHVWLDNEKICEAYKDNHDNYYCVMCGSYHFENIIKKQHDAAIRNVEFEKISVSKHCDTGCVVCGEEISRYTNMWNSIKSKNKS